MVGVGLMWHVRPFGSYAFYTFTPPPNKRRLGSECNRRLWYSFLASIAGCESLGSECSRRLWYSFLMSILWDLSAAAGCGTHFLLQQHIMCCVGGVSLHSVPAAFTLTASGSVGGVCPHSVPAAFTLTVGSWLVWHVRPFGSSLFYTLYSVTL